MTVTHKVIIASGLPCIEFIVTPNFCHATDINKKEDRDSLIKLSLSLAVQQTMFIKKKLAMGPFCD